MTAFHASVAVVADGGGDTIIVTGTVVVAFPALIVMVALWVPAESPLVLTLTVSVVFVVIEVVVGETVSQGTLSEVVTVIRLVRFRDMDNV